MVMTTAEIIEETNEIALGLYNGARKTYGKNIISTEAHELRVASIHAASRTMQAQILAKVIDNKSFR